MELSDFVGWINDIWNDVIDPIFETEFFPGITLTEVVITVFGLAFVFSAVFRALNHGNASDLAPRTKSDKEKDGN